MKELIERFYNSVRNGDALPIPYREILLTAHIMDETFAQIYPPTKTQASELVCGGNYRSEGVPVDRQAIHSGNLKNDGY